MVATLKEIGSEGRYGGTAPVQVLPCGTTRRFDGWMMTIDPGSAVPPYQQICDAVAARIDSGELAVGARLPTVRGLAQELGVAPGTVAKAYSELDAAGLISTAGRAGTRVAANGDGKRALAAAAAGDFADRVRRLGLPPEELLRIVGARLTGD